MAKKILLAGESWSSHTTHVNGFDTFFNSVYKEGAKELIKALEASGYEVEHMPAHRMPYDFPITMDEINEYACIILSDVGSNTLIHPDTLTKSIRTPNRCMLIRDYVRNGGALLMMGGYMSFSGIEGKARYGHTAIADVLPVTCMDYDDLMEHPEGIYPKLETEHPALAKVPGDWPFFLGYNRTKAREGATVAMSIEGDPFIAFGDYGKGRSAAFTTDCAPHWGPNEFMNWEGYVPLFAGIVDYITRS